MSVSAKFQLHSRAKHSHSEHLTPLNDSERGPSHAQIAAVYHMQKVRDNCTRGYKRAYTALLGPHLVIPDVNFTSGTISLPSSPMALLIFIVVSIDAMAIHTLPSARKRPGQILKHRVKQMPITCIIWLLPASEPERRGGEWLPVAFWR